MYIYTSVYKLYYWTFRIQLYIFVVVYLSKIFRRKDDSLDRFIEIKTTLAQM